MKGAGILCISEASTGIYLSMDQASSSSSSSSTMQLGGRTIDRHNPIISDSRRSIKTSSDTPSSSSSASSVSPINPRLPKTNNKTNPLDKIIKSSKKLKDPKKNSSDSGRKNSFSSKPSPPGSSRYLLGDKDRHFSDGLSDFDPVFAMVPAEDQNKIEHTVNEVRFATSSVVFPSSPPKPTSSNQVVVLTVSLHCKGCEGKLKKHLSRMKGVTSYNIDFAAKKVTIVGDVTPFSVLASVTKVKNARFWTPTAAPLTPISTARTNAEIN